mmetsp:Transcript_6099/g.11287  ORF Transcript_6099/g.11287 Transcript_6099/m.11287 type:complete len:119 (-) Transcript_6099:16-372(-)
MAHGTGFRLPKDPCCKHFRKSLTGAAYSAEEIKTPKLGQTYSKIMTFQSQSGAAAAVVVVVIVSSLLLGKSNERDQNLGLVESIQFNSMRPLPAPGIQYDVAIRCDSATTSTRKRLRM